MAGVMCSRLSIDLQKLLCICGPDGWRNNVGDKDFGFGVFFIGQKTVIKTRLQV